MLVRLGLLQLCWALASSYPYAGQPERYPLPEKALVVPHSTEADMLAPDIVAAILLFSDVEWLPGGHLPHVWRTADCRHYLATKRAGLRQGEVRWLLLIMLR